VFEIIKNKDVKLDTISIKQNGKSVDNQGSFVKIEHLNSGITVTKFDAIQIKAKNKAIDELESLLKIYYKKEH